MWNITRKNVAANKIRLALTALAIVLGVGFISSANILSDGLSDSFASLAEEIVQGTDLEVERADDVPLTQTEVDAINNIDGVRVAVGGYGSDDVFPIRSDGTVVRPEGPPVFANSWNTDAQLNPTTIETGRAPEGPGEWVIDFGSADSEGFVVGETYELIVPTAEGFITAELVGTFRFGAENQTNGAVLMAFEAETAQVLFDRDNFGNVQIAVDGTRPIVDVRTDVEAAFGVDAGYIVQDTAELNAETTAEFNSFISVFAWILRSFAIVALFVSIFIIANTFNIVMSQRVRELGLLRAVGATPKQVRRAVMGEALLVGLVASAIGLIAGLGLAYGLEAFLNAVGGQLPPFDKPLSVATILIGMGVGVGVTLLSAWVPARRAGLTSPVTAISGHDVANVAGGQRSIVLGTVLSIGGAALTGVALFGGIESTVRLLVMLGVGAALLFVGITLVSPLFAAPISRALGAPIAKVYNRPGVLAKENAARNPKRTATTAAALMIGLSLVSMAFVVGQTLKNDLNELLETTVQADYAAFPIGVDGVPNATFDAIESSPEFGGVTGMRYWSTEILSDNAPLPASSVADEAAPENIEVATLDLNQIDDVFNLDLIDGSYADITNDSLAIYEPVAEQLAVGLGDTVSVRLDDDSVTEMGVAAIFADGNIFGGVIVNETRWNTIGDQESFDWIVVTVADGVTTEAADEAIATIAADFPQIETQSAAQYREDISGQVDNLLLMLTGFLALAIFIAFIGIVNTMALSIFERTRELGLLRAVGMTRTQMHKMVRWEAAIVSLVGALLGAGVGIVFGVLVVVATPDFVLSNLAIPWLSLVGLVAAAGVAGLIAGFLPARRAGKLNVLDAIST